MRTRRLVASAALLAVALATAGCGPDDSSGTGSTTAAAPPAASGAPSATASADPAGGSSPTASGGASAAASGAGSTAASTDGQGVSSAEEGAFEKASMDVNGCAAYYRTHQVLLVESASAGQLKGVKVKTECGPYGLRLDTGSNPSGTFKLAAGATVVMFVRPTAGSSNSKGYPRYEVRKVSFADYAKSHQPCFDTPEPDNRPAGLQCGGLFLYTTDGSGAVTSMHETWEVND
ncbi:hypothetical protein K353_02935 [Kitasatospora sp. SolWspMP-SS2h]|uniref:hypothetical protein n=1 Tax=Kitasatospora sp. SolWspMP-SS2h TaxID=1305729 RepID=UPI000DBF6CE1|nr:hypothetical protein [Kitasatospora sp. SolWspMP-SS2h]RAJ41824.1 hypothetical protein K353_02935 [Kitasatospora sp. SolWspMP-SS2h]